VLANLGVEHRLRRGVARVRHLLKPVGHGRGQLVERGTGMRVAHGLAQPVQQRRLVARAFGRWLALDHGLGQRLQAEPGRAGDLADGLRGVGAAPPGSDFGCRGLPVRHFASM
jgi:hypothetical protein